MHNPVELLTGNTAKSDAVVCEKLPTQSIDNFFQLLMLLNPSNALTLHIINLLLWMDSMRQKD